MAIRTSSRLNEPKEKVSPEVLIVTSFPPLLHFYVVSVDPICRFTIACQVISEVFFFRFNKNIQLI